MFLDLTDGQALGLGLLVVSFCMVFLFSLGEPKKVDKMDMHEYTTYRKLAGANALPYDSVSDCKVCTDQYGVKYLVRVRGWRTVQTLA